MAMNAIRVTVGTPTQ